MFADGLSSSEWSDRKGAAEAIRTILESMQEVISPSKWQIQQLLEEHKFDKVRWFQRNGITLFLVQTCERCYCTCTPRMPSDSFHFSSAITPQLDSEKTAHFNQFTF